MRRRGIPGWDIGAHLCLLLAHWWKSATPWNYEPPFPAPDEVAKTVRIYMCNMCGQYHRVDPAMSKLNDNETNDTKEKEQDG